VPRTLSEFHYSTVFIDGIAFSSAERLHDELALKLGFPDWYGRNWDALLDCLSSIDDPASNLCAHWEFRSGKRLVFSVRSLSMDSTDAGLLLLLAQTLADANSRLRESGQGISIWIEFTGKEAPADYRMAAAIHDAPRSCSMSRTSNSIGMTG